MRDDFSKLTLDILAKRVGIRCSNAGCRKLTTGPRNESSQIINIGVGAHITAATPGGPRFGQIYQVRNKNHQTTVFGSVKIVPSLLTMTQIVTLQLFSKTGRNLPNVLHYPK